MSEAPAVTGGGAIVVAPEETGGAAVIAVTADGPVVQAAVEPHGSVRIDFRLSAFAFGKDELRRMTEFKT